MAALVSIGQDFEFLSFFGKKEASVNK